MKFKQIYQPTKILMKDLNPEKRKEDKFQLNTKIK